MTTHTFSNPGLNTGTPPGEDLRKAIGQRYHCGISDGTRYYGYLFEPTTAKDGGFHWRTDTATKDALIAYSSGQLIDRDLAFFPRVTDADFSGGGYQEVFLDPKRYFDADIDPRIPGYLQLRSQWARVSKAGLTVGSNFQVVAFNADFWFTFGEATGNIYSANGGTTTTPGAAAVLSLDVDGSFLYAGTAAKLWRSSDGISWTAVTSSINGTAQQWWVVNQGTNGYFAYYQSGTNLLYKIDLTQAFPIAAAAEPQIPVGSNAINIIDLCAYQTSISILTVDQRGPGCDVWYFDGNNLTRIIRLEGYIPYGMCTALGSLYIALAPVPGAGGVVVGSASGSGAGRGGGVTVFGPGQSTSPILAKIDSGTFQIVARPGSPFIATNQSCLQPRASSQYVYWPIVNPSINGISAGKAVIVQYDVLSGAVMHLPSVDTTDFTTVGGSLRVVAVLGENVAGCYLNGTTGILQYQLPAFGTVKYQTTGWVASSHIDFATPAIVKRFRRVEVHHAPLNAGEAIFVEVFVDQDPLSFTTALAPVPSSQAGGTNNTVGSTITSLTLGQDTVGKTLYFALRLTAGTGQATTPRVSYISIEVGGTWVADVNLVCSSRRNSLAQEADTQGATAADLAYLLFLTQENGNLVTFYHPNGQTYTMTLETLDGWNPTPLKTNEGRPQDEEYVLHAILRQVA